MSNKLKYSIALVASVIAGLIAGSTVNLSTYSYCMRSYDGPNTNCLNDIYMTSVDWEQTWIERVQRGLLFSTSTGLVFWGGINFISKLIKDG